MGQVATFYDMGSGNCETSGAAASNANAGMCNGTNTNFGSHFAGTAPAATGGSCSAPATSDPAKVTDTEVRVCTSTLAACTAELCGGGGPFSNCILAAEDQLCPAGPYTQKHLLGDAPTVTCGTCGCTLSATCKGTIEFFSDMNCSMGALNLPVDGSCVAVNSGTTNYRSYKYTGMVDTTSCDVSPTATATVDLTGKRTVCCQ